MNIQQLALTFFDSAMETTIKSIESTPIDKLNWKPSDTAKSVLQIAAHIGSANGWFCQVMKDGKTKYVNPAEEFSGSAQFESQFDTKEKVIQLLSDTSEQLKSMINGFSESDMANKQISFFGNQRPLYRFIFIPEGHTSDHAAQMNYLQTIWGDLEMR